MNVWPIPAEAIAAMMAHAAAEFPRESCGLVVDGVYLPQENVAKGRDEFEIADSVMMANWDRIDAVIHSHCFKNRELGHRTNPRMFGPSHQDMVQQMATQLTWGIVPVVEGGAVTPYFWGDDVPTAPLIGREFIHGVQDCYSAIRDGSLALFGRKLPNFPRGWGWWRKLTTGGLYIEGFRKAGFVRITREEIRPGDVILGSIEAKVLNHGGLVLPDDADPTKPGLLLHHWVDDLSGRVPITGDGMTTFLRYQEPGE